MELPKKPENSKKGYIFLFKKGKNNCRRREKIVDVYQGDTEIGLIATSPTLVCLKNMIIRRDCRLIFVHIPKIAGTSITMVLKNLPVKNVNKVAGLIHRTMNKKNAVVYNKHTKAIRIKTVVGNYMWRKYFKF